MKVLQTLGHRAGFPPTPFYYRRETKGVRIESIVGKRIRRLIPIDEWTALLAAIAHPDRSQVFGVSSSLGSQSVQASVHDLISETVTGADDRLCAYATAILIHEGTLMIDHGPLGSGWEARVALLRSEPEFEDISYASRHPENPK